MKYATVKTIIRTLFYQFLILFVGVSVGFIANAEYVGWKSAIVAKSYRHIFFPVQFDDRVEAFVQELGRMRLSQQLTGHPFGDLSDVIVDERVWGEEYYDALYKDPTKAGQEDEIQLFSTRVRWKPWEYYYEYHSPTGDDLTELLKNETETPRAVEN